MDVVCLQPALGLGVFGGCVTDVVGGSIVVALRSLLSQQPLQP